jgi:hypothetical protein
MNEAAEAVTPTVQETPAEQVQQVEAVSTEATTEQAQVETPEVTSEEKAKKEPWFQKRIGELTREKYEGRREAEQARQEAAQLREQLARVQQGEQVQTNQPPATAVEEAARRMLAEKSFNEACNKVYATGKQEFSDFDAAVSNLQMVGVNRDFLEFTAASDAGAKLIHHLGKDLDEAARISALPPVLMARELARLELKLNQPQAKPLVTIDMVTREALRIAHEKCQFIGTVDRQYDDSFAKTGAKIGSALRVRKPNQYTRTTGSRVMDVQDQAEGTSSITLATQDHVDMRFNSAELALSIDEISKRYIEPAVARCWCLASSRTSSPAATKATYNVAGTAGTALTDLVVPGAARAKLNQGLAPKDGNRYIQADSVTMGGLVNGLKGCSRTPARSRSSTAKG